MKQLLSAKNISHTFEYELFSNISLELNEGESIAIIGASGSGKSTLLHILSTLLTPKEGDVELFSKSIKEHSQRELSEIKRTKLGLIFQSHYLFKGFSAYENLEVAAILSQEKIENSLLKRLDIEKVIKQKVTELSGGQQQRVSIARVLTKKPRIIFADEPTGNLDKTTAHNVINLLFEYIKSNDAGMVLVTHDEELAFMCQKVYRVENRELVKVK
jgi:putative ABC transport system ATP-binding protein